MPLDTSRPDVPYMPMDKALKLLSTAPPVQGQPVRPPVDAPYWVPCDQCRRQMRLIEGTRYACMCGRVKARDLVLARLAGTAPGLLNRERGE